MKMSIKHYFVFAVSQMQKKFELSVVNYIFHKNEESMLHKVKKIDS